MNKKLIAAIAAAAALSACGTNGNGVSLGIGLGGFSRHVGIGTSVNIPSGGRQADTDEKGGLRVIEEQIVTYFDAEGRATEHGVKGGYYRQLLKKQSKRDYLVQDFYFDGQKRSDPMVIARENLFVFRAHPENGVLTVYAINGAVMQQQNYRNGQPVQVGR